MENKISVISQNVMADLYTMNHIDDRYGHVKDKNLLTWDYRYPILITQIIDNDIICLQEVEIKNIPTSKILLDKLNNIKMTTYKNLSSDKQELIKNKINSLKDTTNTSKIFSPFFIPELEKTDSTLSIIPIKNNFVDDLLNYDYVHNMICNVKTNICDKYTNPIGNMILWKKDKFELLDFVLKSYGVFIKLRHINTKFEFLLGNIHLKAGLYSGFKERSHQLNSCFDICKKMSEIDKKCIVGDFNDELTISGSNTKIINDNKFIIAESYPTCDIYNHNADTHQYYTFDHVIHYNLDIKISEIPEVDTFPNKNNPSDHLPLIFDIII